MADDGQVDDVVGEEELFRKHRQERKQLQAEIQRLKHSVPKGDKKKKKEVSATVAQLEAELDARQEAERQEVQQCQVNHVTDLVSKLCTDSGAEVPGAQPKEQKISKAQRKREKKSQKQQDREAEIRKQEIENLMGPRHVETKKIKAMLAKRDLALYEDYGLPVMKGHLSSMDTLAWMQRCRYKTGTPIPSDGNCLYGAIEHQLRSRDVETSVDSLRKQTASHMRSNVDAFLPFLCHQDTGDPYTPRCEGLFAEEFEMYCHKLETTPEWGGQLELQALATALRLPIEVIQADTPIIKVGEEHEQNPIILTYHRHYYGLGEHYNSVTAKPEEDEDNDEGFS